MLPHKWAKLFTLKAMFKVVVNLVTKLTMKAFTSVSRQKYHGIQIGSAMFKIANIGMKNLEQNRINSNMKSFLLVTVNYDFILWHKLLSLMLLFSIKWFNLEVPRNWLHFQSRPFKFNIVRCVFYIFYPFINSYIAEVFY